MGPNKDGLVRGLKGHEMADNKDNKDNKDTQKMIISYNKKIPL